jgi:hypothetical protein
MLMEISMREFGRMIKHMEKESTDILMVLNIMEIG